MMPPLPDLGCLADVTYTVRAENRSSGSPGNLELLFSLLTSLCLDHQTMAPASLRDWEVLPSPSDQGRQVSSCLPAYQVYSPFGSPEATAFLSHKGFGNNVSITEVPFGDVTSRRNSL